MYISFDDGLTLSVLSYDDSALSDWAFEFQENNLKAVCRFVRGKKCKTGSGLFDEFAAALQFPYYFGENWNAFEDCISDLNWLDCDLCVVVVSDANFLLASESSSEFKLFLDILQRARARRTLSLQSVDWAKKDLPFFVLLQEKTNGLELRRRLDIAEALYSSNHG